jgi:hypothetical protein
MDAFGPLTLSPSSRNEFLSFKDDELTSCLFCSTMFVLPHGRASFSSHLFSWHQFQIADIEMIASVNM